MTLQTTLTLNDENLLMHADAFGSHPYTISTYQSIKWKRTNILYRKMWAFRSNDDLVHTCTKQQHQNWRNRQRSSRRPLRSYRGTAWRWRTRNVCLAISNDMPSVNFYLPSICSIAHGWHWGRQSDLDRLLIFTWSSPRLRIAPRNSLVEVCFGLCIEWIGNVCITLSSRTTRWQFP